MRSPGLQQKLEGLETHKATLETAIAAAPVAAPRLMPNLAEVYKAKVTALQEALRSADGTEALEAVRSLIEQVVVRPGASGGLEIELIGAIASMLRLAQGPGSRGSAAPDPDLFMCFDKDGCGDRI